MVHVVQDKKKPDGVGLPTVQNLIAQHSAKMDGYKDPSVYITSETPDIAVFRYSEQTGGKSLFKIVNLRTGAMSSIGPLHASNYVTDKKSLLISLSKSGEPTSIRVDKPHDGTRFGEQLPFASGDNSRGFQLAPYRQNNRALQSALPSSGGSNSESDRAKSTSGRQTGDKNPPAASKRTPNNDPSPPAASEQPVPGGKKDSSLARKIFGFGWLGKLFGGAKRQAARAVEATTAGAEKLSGEALDRLGLKKPLPSLMADIPSTEEMSFAHGDFLAAATKLLGLGFPKDGRYERHNTRLSSWEARPDTSSDKQKDNHYYFRVLTTKNVWREKNWSPTSPSPDKSNIFVRVPAKGSPGDFVPVRGVQGRLPIPPNNTSESSKEVAYGYYISLNGKGFFDTNGRPLLKAPGPPNALLLPTNDPKYYGELTVADNGTVSIVAKPVPEPKQSFLGRALGSIFPLNLIFGR